MRCATRFALAMLLALLGVLAHRRPALAGETQPVAKDPKQGHSFYASANLGIGGSVSVNGEYALIRDLLKVRAGYAMGLGLYGTGHGPRGMLHIMNRGRYKIELGLGAFYLFRTAEGDLFDENAKGNRWLPALYLGYRYQPEVKHVFWRVGIAADSPSPGLSGAVGWVF